ncbi:MAG TPA: cell wall-binding repeat-containing protein, partial [Clostridium sp.]|nr:cell wall-binding repeat-containing protein [Clostridium sp.]
MKNKKVRTFFFLALILICFSIKTYGFGERVDYIIGMDRYETSALLSEANYAKSPYAVIASGESYIDALTSSPLAFSKKAPILLTNKNKLNEFTKGEILRLGTKNVYIVGGNGAVSEGVEEEIKNLGIQV